MDVSANHKLYDICDTSHGNRRKGRDSFGKTDLILKWRVSTSLVSYSEYPHPIVNAISFQ